MVSDLRTPILKSFYYSLWFYFVTVSEFSYLAKPYPVSGLTPMPQILKQVTTLPWHYLALYMGYMWDRVYHIPFPC